MTGQYKFRLNCILIQIRVLLKFTVKISFINLFKGIKGILTYDMVQKITWKEFSGIFADFHRIWKKVLKKVNLNQIDM